MQDDQVERLDFSNPPPGMWADEAIWNGEGQEPAADEVYSWGFNFEDGILFYRTLALALAAAWAHYKKHHDPPGLFLDWAYDETGSPGGECSVEIDVAEARLIVFSVVAGDRHLGESEARAAAWTWYEWRNALAQRLSTGPFVALNILSIDRWPRCLAWSDADCDAVERWLAVGGEMPEVLRAA